MAANLHALEQRRLIDRNGVADGASIYFYTTGTLTPATIYSDFALTTPLANPVVVEAGASVPDIYLDDSVTYRRRIVYDDGTVDDTDPYQTPAAALARVEAAQTAAETAQTGAETAETNAEAAKTAAETARDTALTYRDDAQAALAGGIASYYPGARSNVPQGATGTGAITGGSGGTDGTFALAFTGGNFSVNPTGTFTVSGGAVTAITITGPGLYIGGAISAPTLDFSASTGLTGASASLTTDVLVASGEYYYTDHATDTDQIAYFQNDGGTATEVDASVDWLNVAQSRANAEAAAASATVNRLTRYEETRRPNLINWGSVDRWVKSTSAASFTYGETNGIGSYTLSHSSTAMAHWNVVRDTSETEVSYHIALEAKTGGTGATTGRLIIYEIDEPDGSIPTGGYTVLAATTVPFPSGSVSTKSEYSGTVTLNANTSRIIFSVDLQAATSITFSEPSIGYGSLEGLRQPPVNSRGNLEAINYPLVAGFENRYTTGAFDAVSDALSTISKWYVNSDGDLQIVTGENSMRLWNTGLSRPATGAWQFDSSATVTGTDTSAGVGIAVGDGSGRQVYVYLRNGFVGVLNNSSSTVSGGVASGMTYNANEEASLSLTVRPDGTGILVATNPSGGEFTTEVSGVPTGSVWAAWRRATTGKIHKLTRAHIADKLEDRVSTLEATTNTSTSAVLQSFTVLPDSSEGRSPKGFTCTGLDRITRGDYAGCWIVADDGRLLDTGGSALDAKVHILSPDFQRILVTHDLGVAESAQGVTVDTSGSVDTFWVALSTAQVIRHYSMDGSEISGDAFDWSAAGYTGDPNGIAYDAANDALWVSTTADATVRRIDCDPAASPRLVDTHTLETGIDQLHYDGDNGLLYYTKGTNGSDGSVGVYRTATSAISSAYGPLARAQAIEGLYIDRDTLDLFIVNDGGFHVAASPALNIALRYRVPLIT